jgi:hypothetical protein
VAALPRDHISSFPEKAAAAIQPEISGIFLLFTAQTVAAASLQPEISCNQKISSRLGVIIIQLKQSL